MLIIGINFSCIFNVSFPKDENKRLLWAKSVKRKNTTDGSLWRPNTHNVICSKHFKENAFDRTGQIARLKNYAIPCIFDFPHYMKVSA